ncbi:MAG: GNAT family N-acetyltransferase [Deltaproteobacteria bacterium]|nr:GNAT family N-acetyltransferase [Deltaproteobacteria bacterium]
MNLRPLAPGDDIKAHVRAIYEEHGLGYDPEFEDDLEDPVASYAGGAFWVMEDDAGIVACGGVVPTGGARCIKRMYVAPRGRRLGLAREILALAMRWGDFERTELWSDVRFRKAHQLYMSEGFRMGHTRVLDDPDRSVERYFWRLG